MKKSSKKKQVFRSMIEFEKKYFPKSYEQKMTEKRKDARALGISLAEESLNKIRARLAK